MTVGPDPAPDEARFPVFVDDTGRRHRRLRWTGWLVGALAAAYVALFAVSIASSPGLLPLSIPGVGRLLPNSSAPDIPVAGHGKQHPAQVVSSVTPTPTPVATAPVPTPTPAATSTPRRSARPTAQPTPTRTVGRTNAPSATPTATPTTRGSPTAHPTPRGSGKPSTRPTHAARR